MKISTYISQLLYRYECVILPGFGAFLTHTVPAKVSGEPVIFYPPGKVLSFNALLQVNDGLLAGFIAQKENLAYEAALEKLRQEVGQLKRLLESEETIRLDNIGTLNLTPSGSISFEPDTNCNYLRDAFGLASFSFPAVERVISTEEKTVVPIEKTPRKSWPIARYAAVGLLAIGVAALGRMYYLNQQIEQHNFAEKQKAVKQVEAQIQQATFVMSDPLPAITFSVKKPFGDYHIVAGAFRVEENAFSHIEALKSKGYPARLLDVSKYGLYQVVYGSYPDKEAAMHELRKIQTSENPDAWLLVQETE